MSNIIVQTYLQNNEKQTTLKEGEVKYEKNQHKTFQSLPAFVAISQSKRIKISVV